MPARRKTAKKKITRKTKLKGVVIVDGKTTKKKIARKTKRSSGVIVDGKTAKKKTTRKAGKTKARKKKATSLRKK